MRYTTLIELHGTEKTVGNYCFLHPAKEGIHSNLNLITDKGTVYSFTLDDSESTEPDLKVVIEPSDASSLAAARGLDKLVPATEVAAAQAQAHLANAHVAAAVEQFRAEYPTRVLQFDYTFREEKPFDIAAIYQDENSPTSDPQRRRSSRCMS